MSATINDGGPAFPYAFEHNDGERGGFAPGMSLRDWFAGQALAGMLANAERFEKWGWNEYAPEAYVYADEMLKARSKGGAA